MSPMRTKEIERLSASLSTLDNGAGVSTWARLLCGPRVYRPSSKLWDTASPIGETIAVAVAETKDLGLRRACSFPQRDRPLLHN